MNPNYEIPFIESQKQIDRLYKIDHNNNQIIIDIIKQKQNELRTEYSLNGPESEFSVFLATKLLRYKEISFIIIYN